MSERFLKFIPSEEAFWLMKRKPNAFTLLTYIANTARRFNGHPDGLMIGQCHLQHWKTYGLSEQKYRTAKLILIQRKHIIIIETNRTRQKSTTGTTTNSTLVQLCSNTIWDINPEVINDRINDRATTEQRPSNDKQERRRRDKRYKEDHHPYPSSLDLSNMDNDLDGRKDFSEIQEKEEQAFQHTFEFKKKSITVSMPHSMLEDCLKIKGSLDSVKHAIEFIMRSPTRKHKITNWPNALSTWEIKNPVQLCVKENEHLGKHLDQQYSNATGWRCELHKDFKKDQKGVLFYNPLSTGNSEPIFLAFIDPEFKQKTQKIVREKLMDKK